MDSATLTQTARDVLRQNDLGGWTRPTAKLYPHQWLWDSCFIAIGLRHYDIERAQAEIRSLLRGQWRNGMMPYIVFSDATTYHAGPGLWQSHVSPEAPAIATSGGTQPPVLAEAVVRIGRLLPELERRRWYDEVYQPVADFHEWFYRERDPDGTGLVTLLHSWETGMDNTPPWMEMLHRHALSPRLRLVDKSRRLERFLVRFRRDTSVVPAEERMSTLDLLAFYDIVGQMRRYRYDSAALFKHQKLLLTDLNVSAILVRANDHLAEMAAATGRHLPPLTARHHGRGTAVLEPLWDETDGYYYCRDYRTGRLVKQPSVATFVPLYAGQLPSKRVERLLGHLHDPASFGTPYPIPSTPLNSPYYKPTCYWQGPVWVNMNWLVIDGLDRNGQTAEADRLRQRTLRLIAGSGMYEYFSTLTGQAAGAPVFSWTAALALDLLAHNKGGPRT